MNISGAFALHDSKHEIENSNGKTKVRKALSPCAIGKDASTDSRERRYGINNADVVPGDTHIGKRPKELRAV